MAQRLAQRRLRQRTARRWAANASSAGILAELRDRRVRNMIWLTADVHYAAATTTIPARATGATFDPFWELVAGPIHAGTFAPPPRSHVRPEVKFQWAPDPGQSNLAPWDGLQSFGRSTQPQTPCR